MSNFFKTLRIFEKLIEKETLQVNIFEKAVELISPLIPPLNAKKPTRPSTVECAFAQI